ncbi:MAG: bifunctional (p)ppGpp synthetase/guanosine-3',5'-bis(diphosphate) 3'-pyrophosphohydrolase [Chloroflexaceae bacterium]|nr:bifunctional (p)ppGpp synthetase/guanosine-3',5'-bis(diphosphate) 3'-pyrophosphohydrolase [Chloroflexaceae bacterium]
MYLYMATMSEPDADLLNATPLPELSVQSRKPHLNGHTGAAISHLAERTYLNEHRAAEAVMHSPTADALVAHFQRYHPTEDGDLIRQAYALACMAHEGQKRQSGEPYVNHPVAVATILLDLEMDSCTLAAALLHDVVEDTAITLDHITQVFGEEIAYLVDGVTKLSALEARTKEEAQAGSYRKMFIAMADDPRVVLIKLADRVHNMRTLDATPPEKQQRVARETLEIYAPLASRLGIWRMKSELEDLSFKVLNREKYREIARQLMLRREARERIIERVMSRLRIELEKESIVARISGRPKHIYSIYRKMERKGVSLDQIYDQLAVRIIVEEVGECYRVLGIVHNIWTPVLSEFDDYIAVPKESMYRSLHTTVLIPGGTPCEVQIRTREMHEVAERGIAAHWRYKEGFNRSDKNFESKLTWLRSLIEWRREMTDAHEFVESLKTDVFEEQVYVFTPRGKIIDLPVGSTPVDFAYRIHSEIGHRCIGAKVNNRIAPLDHQLQNSDIVDIMTSKSDRGPSRDWLNFVKTSSARSHIRRYFRRLERAENIAAGRDLLEKEMKRLGVTIAFDEVASISGWRGPDDLFAFIGCGETTARQVLQKVLAQSEQTADDLAHIPQITPPPRPDAAGIQVRGTGSVLTRLARCCNPVVGEPITGYVTRGRGITIHRADCHSIDYERDRERLVEVHWGERDPQGYPVPIRIESWDRVGLWRDVSSAVADANINIEELQQVQTQKDGRTILVMRLNIQSIDQLTMILDKLNRVPNVIEARRVNGSAEGVHAKDRYE